MDPIRDIPYKGRTCYCPLCSQRVYRGDLALATCRACHGTRNIRKWPWMTYWIVRSTPEMYDPSYIDIFRPRRKWIGRWSWGTEWPHRARPHWGLVWRRQARKRWWARKNALWAALHPEEEDDPPF